MPLLIPPSTLCDEEATEIITWSRLSGDGNDQEECLVTPRRDNLFAFSHRRHGREHKTRFAYPDLRSRIAITQTLHTLSSNYLTAYEHALRQLLCGL